MEKLFERVEAIHSHFLHAKTREREARKEVESKRMRLERLKTAQSILQLLASRLQNEAHGKISKLVTHCLQSVFGSSYVFTILFENKRGKTEARLAFLKDGVERDPMTECGGGLVDVAAFALRLSCLLIDKRAPRKAILLDEPFKFVSSEFREAVSSMLLQLSENLKLQIIMVTHIPELKTGKVINLS